MKYSRLIDRLMFGTWIAVVLLIVFPHSTLAGSNCKLGPKLVDPNGSDHGVFGTAVAIDADVVVVGDPMSDSHGAHSGSAYVYRLSGDQIADIRKLIPSSTSPGMEFGTSVSVDGDIVVVSAQRDDMNTGSAYVFHYDAVSGDWIEVAKLAPDGAEKGDVVGHSVSISRNAVLITAPHANMHSGAAYVFRFDGNGWIEEAVLVASDVEMDDHFGMSGALSGNLAIIGSAHDSDAGTESGSAYIFRFDPATGTWNEEAKLMASDAQAEQEFGYSVSAHGKTVVVGAYHHEWEDMTTGSAYVFRFHPQSGTWIEQANFKSPNVGSMDAFGCAVAVSRNRLLVGAYANDGITENAGAVYAYRYNGTGWTDEPMLTAFDSSVNGYFGIAVALSGGVAAVGSIGDGQGNEDTGSAYVLLDAFSGDCNENGALDVCDIADGTSSDDNGDGIPDECQT